MAGDIAFISEKTFFVRGKKKKKTEWIFGSFLPGLPGSKKRSLSMMCLES